MADDQSTHRSELTGVIGILAMVAVLVKHYNITSGSITIALDGESVLGEAKGDWPLQIDHAPVLHLLRHLIGTCI